MVNLKLLNAPHNMSCNTTTQIALSICYIISINSLKERQKKLLEKMENPKKLLRKKTFTSMLTTALISTLTSILMLRESNAQKWSKKAELCP